MILGMSRRNLVRVSVHPPCLYVRSCPLFMCPFVLPCLSVRLYHLFMCPFVHPVRVSFYTPCSCVRSSLLFMCPFSPLFVCPFGPPGHVSSRPPCLCVLSSPLFVCPIVSPVRVSVGPLCSCILSSPLFICKFVTLFMCPFVPPVRVSVCPPPIGWWCKPIFMSNPQPSCFGLLVGWVAVAWLGFGVMTTLFNFSQFYFVFAQIFSIFHNLNIGLLGSSVAQLCSDMFMRQRLALLSAYQRFQVQVSSKSAFFG